MAWLVTPLFGPVIAVTTKSMANLVLVEMQISTSGIDSLTVIFGPMLNMGTIVCVMCKWCAVCVWKGGGGCECGGGGL